MHKHLSPSKIQKLRAQAAETERVLKQKAHKQRRAELDQALTQARDIYRYGPASRVWVKNYRDINAALRKCRVARAFIYGPSLLQPKGPVQFAVQFISDAGDWRLPILKDHLASIFGIAITVTTFNAQMAAILERQHQWTSAGPTPVKALTHSDTAQKKEDGN